jgi:threonine 3-dehydrogenase
MKALVKAKNERGIWMQDVPEPVIGPNDVIIKIHKTAICGTDMHIYNWDEWAQNHIKTPMTAGHEFVGEIIEVGKEVKSYFDIGDRVSGEGHIACLHCRNCRGVTRNGAFAEYLCIPATNAYPIPKEIPDSQASIMDPFGNAAHTTLSFDLVGEDVLITGAGPVGIMAAAIAKHVGARHVVITDVNQYRLDLAKKVGATMAVNPTQTSLSEVMAQLGMLEGFDVGLEMSGNASAFNDMINFMNHSGKIALLGFLPKNTGIDWSQIIMKGIIMKGIYGREMYDTWHKMITMLQSGLNIAPVITHEFPIEDFQKGFDIMSSGNSGKVVLNWD